MLGQIAVELLMKFFILFSLLFHFHTVFAACVVHNDVELKSKADGKGKVSLIVGLYTPLIEIQRKGAWIQVSDVDGVDHWIHARYLNRKVNCLIVRSSIAQLRTGPGKEFPTTPLSFAKKYTTFKKIQRDEDWLKVQDIFGQVHWLHETAVWEPRIRTKLSY